jgi:hypothetical protein
MENLDSSFVFQTDSDLVKESLNNPNYLIEYSDVVSISKEKYCIVYFSSHNIYYPNNQKEFKNKILNKNRFEWYGVRIKKGSKHIFIRDNKKQWYLNGINKDVNSIEKLEVFLKHETKGYKTIMLGSSAGGYAAVLFGSLLKSEHVISFNGQFQFYDLLETSSEDIDPVIFRNRDNKIINNFYSLKSYINNPEKVFYFWSKKSNWDRINRNHVASLGLSEVAFNTKNHGIPFLKTALNEVINMPYQKLLKLKNKTYHPVFFSMKYGGVKNTLAFIYKLVLKKWKR